MPIISAIAMSHVALHDAPDGDQAGRLRDHFSACAARFEEARPDVMVAFLDDHFENFGRPMMPALALAVGEEHAGPPPAYESWLRVPRRAIPGSGARAEELLRSLVRGGFDICRFQKAELGHNLIEPLRHFGDAAKAVPVIPIFVNVFTSPTPQMARVHDLGQAVAAAVDSWDERVLVIGTGGLSHSPLYWNEESPDTEFFRRMRKFQEGRLEYLAADGTLFSDMSAREIQLGEAGELSINEEWDRAFLDALARGNHGFVRDLDVDEMTQVAGAGSREALCWAAVMGAISEVGDPRPDIVGYEAVKPWITGVGFAAYPVLAEPIERVDDRSVTGTPGGR